MIRVGKHGDACQKFTIEAIDNAESLRGRDAFYPEKGGWA